MKASSIPQSATSLPRSPRDDAGRRSIAYLVMMGVRIGCFLLMFIVTPYGWYTWVFALAAIVLPYFAVVIANVSSDMRIARAEAPEAALENFGAPATPSGATPTPGNVYRIEESGDSRER